jgi:peptidoglycan/xylan/chitin deacetylase (PgdA/CDA1 family)
MRILQSWDDGLVSDIRLTEILRRHGAKAAFCLSPGLHQETRTFGWLHENREVWRLSRHELTGVYRGFEIWSHAMTHPYLTDLSPDRLDWELWESRSMLEEQFQQPIRGFCYPFNAYNDLVKNAVHRAGYRWARGTTQAGGGFPPLDPLAFSPCCHFLDRDFWDNYNRCRKTCGVFFFWGHSYELINEGMWVECEAMITRISTDPEAQWVTGADLFEPLA